MRFTVRGGVEALRPAAARTVRAALAAGLDPARGADLELAVHEVLANAHEHGNGADPCRPIDVEVVAEPSGWLQVHVRDAGVGGAPAAVAAEPGTRGRGLVLAAGLVDRLVVEATSSGTSVTLGVLPR